MAGNQSIGSIRGTIEIDYDGAGIVRAVRDTDRLKNGSVQLDNVMRNILGTFGKFAKAGALIGASSLATNGALQLVAGTLAIIAPLAAAGVAILPGLFAAAAGAAVIAKIATIGVGDALKAASGSAEEFHKATKNLAPNARAFAQAYRSALPALKQVQQGIQNTFFSGLGNELTKVVGRVGAVQGSATRLAGALNNVVRQVLAFAQSNTAVNAVNSAFTTARNILVGMDGAIKPLLNAFAGLIIQAEQFSFQIGDGLGGAMTRLAGFIQNIDLAALFEKAAPIAQALGTFLRNLGTIAAELFSVFNVDGANAAGVLGELAGKLASFLQSAQGKAALQAIGTALNAISTGAGQVFLALLNALAPAIVAISPAVTSLATSIAGILTPAINGLAGPLAGLAGFISANVSWLGPLAAAVVAAAAAYRIYVAAQNAWIAAEAIARTLRLGAVATWIANTAAVIAHTTAMVASRIAMVAATAATWLATAATTAFGVVLAFVTSPIGIVIIAIAALVAAIVLLWKNSETFRNIVTGAWNAVKAAALTLWATVVSAFNSIRAGVSAALNAVRSVVSNVWNAVVTIIRSRMDQARNTVASVWNAIRTLIQLAIQRIIAVIATVSRVIQIIKSAFDRARSAAQGAMNSLISLVRGLPGRIAGALGNLGSLLFGKGKELVQGFISGIKSMIGSAKSAASSLIGGVSRFLPGSPAKEGPLSGRGYVLYRARRMVADFAKGMKQTRHLPVAAMAGVVRSVPTTFGPRRLTGAAGTAQGMSATVQPRPGNFGPYQLEIDGKVITSFVVDTITGIPQTVGRTAREGARVSSWAGSGR